MKIDDFVTRAELLIAEGDEASKTRSHISGSPWQEDYIDSAAAAAYRAAGLSFLTNVFGATHPYTTEFARVVHDSSRQTVRQAQAMLRAARNELAGGWFVGLRSLVSAEIFSDFFEMAEYLIGEGYIHPAAVMIGSVLEEHLRQLAAGHDVAVEVADSKGKLRPRKADALNSELVKVGAYNKLDEKQVRGLDRPSQQSGARRIYGVRARAGCSNVRRRASVRNPYSSVTPPNCCQHLTSRCAETRRPSRLGNIVPAGGWAAPTSCRSRRRQKHPWRGSRPAASVRARDARRSSV
ncbi:MAG TPA: hypothetical protein VNA69_10395 [Thermoanaerobaculia bacterium]|nr:hypothetical protein [Thermoanaerobaculia bacterium]